MKKERPERPNWYITASFDNPNYSVPRYFDDTAKDGLNWFIVSSGSDSVWEDMETETPLEVNMSFDVWCEMPTLETLKTMGMIYFANPNR